MIPPTTTTTKANNNNSNDDTETLCVCVCGCVCVCVLNAVWQPKRWRENLFFWMQPLFPFRLFLLDTWSFSLSSRLGVVRARGDWNWTEKAGECKCPTRTGSCLGMVPSRFNFFFGILDTPFGSDVYKHMHQTHDNNTITRGSGFWHTHMSNKPTTTTTFLNSQEKQPYSHRAPWWASRKQKLI